MARMTSMEALDKKIEKAQELVSRKKKEYDAATAALGDLLDKRDFFRCSKSTIIHLDKVVKLKPEITRNILATLTNGENIVVSRRYAGELKQLLGIGG